MDVFDAFQFKISDPEYKSLLASSRRVPESALPLYDHAHLVG
jgi:hypothetical protein